MATLSGATIADTFDSILHVEDNTAGLVATSTDSRVIQDGVGANSALALATDSVRITSTNKLYINDVGGEYISGDGTDLTVTSGDNIILAVGSGGSTYCAGPGGTSNTAFGKDSGDALTTNGNYNAVFGEAAGGALTTGVNNVAVGYNALYRGTTESDDNVAIGYNAMSGNFTTNPVNDCVVIGSGAAAGTLTAAASGAMVIGTSAGAALTTGARTTAIGFEAADALTVGDDNLAIGYQAMSALSTTDVSDNNIAIGNYAMDGVSTLAATNNVFIGKHSGGGGWTGTLSQGNTAIGHSTLTGAMNDADNCVAVGYTALEDITTGSNNVAVGQAAGAALTTGASNTIIGMGAGAGTLLNDSVVIIGESAGSGVQTADASGLIAIGVNAAKAITSGAKNIAIGTNAMLTTVTGGENIAIGYGAMDDTDAGSTAQASGSNIFIGTDAGGGTWVDANTTKNIGIGNACMDAAMDGAINNTAMGADGALGALTTGDNNTCIGYSAGSAITTGGNNIAIGKFAGVASQSPVAISTQSNQLVLGNNDTDDFYCVQSTINTSDERDKTDIETFTHGLDFVNQMRPVTYRWDRRSWYCEKDEEGNPIPITEEDFASVVSDGSKKRAEIQLGFIGQEVQAIEQQYGYSQTKEDGTPDEDTELIVDTVNNGLGMGLQYARVVPVLVNAIKELSAKVTALENA